EGAAEHPVAVAGKETLDDLTADRADDRAERVEPAERTEHIDRAEQVDRPEHADRVQHADRVGRPTVGVPRPRRATRASDRMRAVGIVQRGAEVLRTPARPFELPRQEPVASGVVARLRAVLERICGLHPFSKGVGLAAPQINIGWAAALVRPSGPDAQPIVLLNPRVLDSASDVDKQYEGCLSFFDFRGLVDRPLWVDVETALPNGTHSVNRYERGLARLVLHEIDHLDGRLYSDRMPPDVPLVPVEKYRETGRPWQYR
ncbi:MAG: hypothetical protein QOE03_3164, partial [Micromonosporaceae bacterium]|nr:hypothetical protein [Micromonosporaceae bacterium]